MDNTIVNKDKNMKVCEVCGALQSASDTDKRLTMHLEGKLHTGYLKIRNKLAELKSRRNRRDRSRSPRPIRRDRNQKPDVAETNIYDQRLIFSSRKYGSGQNMPSGISHIKFAEIAIQQNKGYHTNESGLGVTSLGKEWRYYKKELDNIRRKAKKDAERKAEMAQRSSHYERGNDKPREYSRDDGRRDQRGTERSY